MTSFQLFAPCPRLLVHVSRTNGNQSKDPATMVVALAHLVSIWNWAICSVNLPLTAELAVPNWTDRRRTCRFRCAKKQTIVSTRDDFCRPFFEAGTFNGLSAAWIETTEVAERAWWDSLHPLGQRHS